jgi:phage terminase large subunit
VIPYRPRKDQLKLHTDSSRFRVIVCHRRFGKTVFAINEGIKHCLTSERDDERVAYICPFRSQAKANAWDYLLKFTANIPGIKINISDLSVDFPNGSRFSLLGADNAHALRGRYLDLIILDEFAQMSPSIWGEIARPLLSDRHGKAIFIGTPFGRGNAFYDIYKKAGKLEGWTRTLLTVNDTNIIDEEELRQAAAEMSPEEYQQEFMCSWDSAIKGAFYTKELDQATSRITKVHHEKTLPVYTAWDLGMRDATAIWFAQFVGNEVRLINYKQYIGTGLPDIISDINKLGYAYGEHIAPHDIQVRELGTGVSRLETAAKFGIHFLICRNISRSDGIDAVRALLPRCWFDEENTFNGVESLRAYRTEYDSKKRVFSSSPLHDWSSNGADAFRYLAVHFSSKQQNDLFNTQSINYKRRF